MKTKRRQDKNLLLKKEIEVKDLLILQLMKTITENNIKVPDDILKITNTLYAGKKVL